MCPESDPSECLFEVRRGSSATRVSEDLEVGGMRFEFFAHGLNWLTSMPPDFQNRQGRNYHAGSRNRLTASITEGQKSVR